MATTKRKSFFIVMLDAKSAIEGTKNVEAAKLFLKVQKFVESGVYDYYKKADIVAKLSLAGYDIHYIGTTLGCSESAVRTHVFEMSDELYAIFGDEFLPSLVKYPKDKEFVDTVMSNISSYETSIVNLMPQEFCKAIYNLIGNSNQADFDIKDCSREISVLGKFCTESFNRSLVTLNPDKVRYVLRCLNHKGGSPLDRVAILKAITGKEIV